MTYVWALASIWGSFVVALAASWVYGAVSSDGNAVIVFHLVAIVGFVFAAIVSVLVCAGIALSQALAGRADRQASE